MKALHLRNAPASAKVYVPGDASRIESHVFPPEAVDSEQCAAAFQRLGQGFIGYIGDVNNESGSQK